MLRKMTFLFTQQHHGFIFNRYVWCWLSMFIFLPMTVFGETSLLSLSVPKAPVPVSSFNKWFLVYELQLVNPGENLIRIGRIEIFNEYNEKQITYVGNKLVRNSLVYKNGKPVNVNKIIELDKGMGAFIFVWIPHDKFSDVPEKLNHQIWIVTPNADNSAVQVKLLNYDVPVSSDKPVVISPPLKGNGWVASGAPSVDSYHRKALLNMDGKFYLAQRYAADWMQMCPDGSSAQGNMRDNHNWPAFGHEVMAVADGEITKVHQGLPENIPLQFPNQIALADAAGNHVIERIHQDGKDYYVLYAHMQPDSLRVKVGDKIKQGQIMGLLGNTGNSSAPHLHLQVSDANDPLKSEGVPFVFKTATLEGRAQEIDSDFAIWKPFPSWMIKIKEAMPTLDEVYYFSDEASHCRVS